MGKRSTRSRSESRPEWEQLEDWVRGHVQRLIQELLEEEVTEFLGRAKSARRSESDNERGYRNGYGRPRRLTLSSGTVQLRRPRVRNTDVLRDMRRRGLECPRLVIGDGHLGIWGALRNVYPQAAEQRCWNHKILNVLDRLPKRQQDQAKLMLRTIPYAQTRTEAERLRTEFTRWCRDHSYEAACVTLERDWDRMITFYDFPKEHWQHLRTTNPVESPFAALRLRTDAAKRYKRVDRAIAVIWKMLMVAEQRFRRLKAPELIEDVYLGAQYADGIAIESTAEKVAA